MRLTQKQTKKAMGTFEVIGYAILAIVVIVVAIFIFQRIAGGGAGTLDDLGKSANSSANNCIKNPANCKPFGTAPAQITPEQVQNQINAINKADLAQELA